MRTALLISQLLVRKAQRPVVVDARGPTRRHGARRLRRLHERGPGDARAHTELIARVDRGQHRTAPGPANLGVRGRLGGAGTCGLTRELERLRLADRLGREYAFAVLLGLMDLDGDLVLREALGAHVAQDERPQGGSV